MDLVRFTQGISILSDSLYNLQIGLDTLYKVIREDYDMKLNHKKIKIKYLEEAMKEIQM